LAGLSAIRYRQQRYSEAAEYALKAVSTRIPYPRAHYCLGLAFLRLGKTSGAIHAFQNYAKMQPKHVAPLRWLERLVRQSGDHVQADAYNLQAREILEQRRLRRIEKRNSKPQNPSTSTER
jgi:hypothetical protein